MYNICVITDNEFIYNSFKKLIYGCDYSFDFYFSSFNEEFCEKYKNDTKFRPIRLKEKNKTFFDCYDLFFSLHCKQLFPVELVNEYRCINVHPGFNPYNRGWFPQVFSIINGKPAGVTIHEMDEELDHGPIIYQEEIEVNSWDTSFDVYKKIQNLEIEMIMNHLNELVEGKYVAKPMGDEGNINYKTDFDSLCEIKLDQTGSFSDFVNLLRATSFDKYDNAFFIDEKGNKVYVSIKLKKE